MKLEPFEDTTELRSILASAIPRDWEDVIIILSGKYSELMPPERAVTYLTERYIELFGTAEVVQGWPFAYHRSETWITITLDRRNTYPCQVFGC
jgi:hypothetical protein